MQSADYAQLRLAVPTTLAKVTVKRTTGFNVTTYSDVVAMVKFDAALDAVVHANQRAAARHGDAGAARCAVLTRQTAVHDRGGSVSDLQQGFPKRFYSRNCNLPN